MLQQMWCADGNELPVLRPGLATDAARSRDAQADSLDYAGGQGAAREEAAVMWIASTIGFYSVVRDREHKGRVLVRARAKADIFNLYRKFSPRCRMSRPKSDESRDYRWRVSVRKKDWVKIVAQLASEISYSISRPRSTGGPIRPTRIRLI